MVEQSAGELRLVGLHDDGEHLVLSRPGGETFRLAITDGLRAAVRRDRSRLEHLKTQERGFLAPREIQARVRSGLTAEEIAAESGITVEQVRRYEGPVLAERQFIAQQAAATRVGRDNSSPSLGDLVTDRLAARGVETSTLEWDASRPDGHGWIVSVAFSVGGQDRLARWTFDPPARSLHALEDEARWLSETEIADEPIPRRHLASVRSSVYDLESDGSVRPVLDAVDLDPRLLRTPEPEAPSELDQTAAILDDLQGRRGIRQQLELGEDEALFEGFGPTTAFADHDDEVPPGDAPGAHPAEPGTGLLEARVYALPPLSQPVDETPSTADDAPAAEAPAEAPEAEPVVEKTPARPSRRGRSKVPSWDEIVFGGKQD